MAITANVGIGVISLAAADNTVLEQAGSIVRQGIQNSVVYNSTGAPIQLDFYESPDLTSASGVLFSSNSIAANTSQSISELIGQGFEVGQNLIAVAGAVGMELKVTVTRTTT